MTDKPMTMREQMARELAGLDPRCTFTLEACRDPETKIAADSIHFEMVDALLSVMETPSEEASRDIAEDMREAGYGPVSYKTVICAYRAMVKAIRGGA